MPVFGGSRAWSSAQNLLSMVSKDAGSAPRKMPARPGIRKEKVSGSAAANEEVSGASAGQEQLRVSAEEAAAAPRSRKRRLSVGLWLEEDILLGEEAGSTLKEKVARPVLSRVRSLSAGVVAAEPLKQSTSPQSPLGSSSSGGLVFDASIVTETVPEMGCVECRQVQGRKKQRKQRKKTTASVSVQLGDIGELRRTRSRSSSGGSDREDSAIQRDDSPAVTPRDVQILASSIGATIDMSPRSTAKVKKVSKATVSYGALPVERGRYRQRSVASEEEEGTKRRSNSLTSTTNLRLTIRTPSFSHLSKKPSRCRHQRKASTAISPRKKMKAETVLEGFLTRRPSQEDLIERNILEEDCRGKARAKTMLSHLLRKKRRKDLTSLGYQSSDEELLSLGKADKSQRRAEKLLDTVHQRGLLVQDVDIQIISQIGEGAYSDVFLASLGGSLVAVKRLKTTKHTMKAFYRELDCLLKFGHHANVVTLLGVTLEPHKSFVLEYVPCGSIHDLLHDKSVRLSLVEALQLGLEVATGMKEVHSGHILHRDLTTRNILYANGSAVVADFGIARHANCKKGLPHCYSPIGHQRYRAPEVSNKEPYSCKADVYTFGTVLYEMITGEEAWEDIGDKQVAALQREGNTPLIRAEHECPPSVQKLVYKCWSFKPKSRPSFKELVKSLADLLATEEKRSA
mmetsp:Transcript_8416/g.35189  ORF Transcript_8416/g.35189 Transcript_8416/m.35189 type:complete len:683 (-) Transcript_8416:107-2155(-)